LKASLFLFLSFVILDIRFRGNSASLDPLSGALVPRKEPTEKSKKRPVPAEKEKTEEEQLLEEIRTGFEQLSDLEEETGEPVRFLFLSFSCSRPIYFSTTSMSISTIILPLPIVLRVRPIVIEIRILVIVSFYFS
jgi:hypothetical protein